MNTHFSDILYFSPILVLTLSCSPSAVDDTDCTSHEQCQGTFGAGARCSPTGFCVASDELVLGDSCNSAPPVDLEQDNERLFVVSTDSLSNTISDCSPDLLVPGQEGVFQLYMEGGVKWHFHAKPVGGDMTSDTALYVMPGCDGNRLCEGAANVDWCGAGGEEHFTFIPQTSATYYVVLDNQAAGAGVTEYEFEIVRPQCGNGILEHDETCEDGNRTAGDGCDEYCREEIAADGFEAHEANDDPSSASAIVLDANTGTRLVRGILRPCDFDVFAVDIAQAGSSLRVELSSDDGPATDIGSACPGQTPAIDLVLSDPDSQPLGTGSPRDGACPIIDPTEISGADQYVDEFARNLAAGTHYITLGTGKDAVDLFAYKIRFSVLPPESTSP